MNATHGGKRRGAGRKATAKTATVRVPEHGAAVAREMVELLIDYAKEALVLTKWYRTAPEEFKTAATDVELIGIETRQYDVRSVARSRVVVFSATIGGRRAVFAADMSGITQWPSVAREPVMETEDEA